MEYIVFDTEANGCKDESVLSIAALKVRIEDKKVIKIDTYDNIIHCHIKSEIKITKKVPYIAIEIGFGGIKGALTIRIFLGSFFDILTLKD